MCQLCHCGGADPEIHGIPTRYVEGYAVDYTEVLDGTMLDEEQFSYDDYYSGSSELGRTAVVQVYVDDGGAHAWIEVFIRGRWQVVELTPPSSEDEDETQDDFGPDLEDG